MNTGPGSDTVKEITISGHNDKKETCLKSTIRDLVHSGITHRDQHSPLHERFFSTRVYLLCLLLQLLSPSYL